MGIGFEGLVYEMPSKLVDVDILANQAGLNDKMIERMHSGGLRKIPEWDYDTPLSKYISKSINKLNQQVSKMEERTRGIILAHSIPIISPTAVPFFSYCLDKHGFEFVPRIAVEGQPCAIIHMGVQLAIHWLKYLSKGEGIILIGADKAYDVADRLFFGSAMGDVSLAGFLTHSSINNIVLASVSDCNVIACFGEDSPEEDIAKFRKLNPLFIRNTIEKCLEEAKIHLKEVTFIVPHTPYLMIWDTIAELLNFPREKILTEYLPVTGHLNSNDSFVHYIRAVNDGMINSGDLALLVNPGFGGTRGCTLLCR